MQKFTVTFPDNTVEEVEYSGFKFDQGALVFYNRFTKPDGLEVNKTMRIIAAGAWAEFADGWDAV